MVLIFAEHNAVDIIGTAVYAVLIIIERAVFVLCAVNTDKAIIKILIITKNGIPIVSAVTEVIERYRRTPSESCAIAAK